MPDNKLIQTTKPKTTKGEQSRAKIVASTRQILAEGDLSSLTLDDVAAQSGVAKSSVLWHFGSKNGLLLTVVDNIFSELQLSLSNIRFEGESAKSRLEKLAEVLAAEMQKTPEANALLIAFIVNKTMDQSIIQQIRVMYQAFRESIKSLLMGQDFKVDLQLASTILAVIDGVYLQWYLDPERIDLATGLKSALNVLHF